MTVKTTKKTRDPFSIIKGRDMLRLISRGFPVTKAKEVLEDGIECEILKIGNYGLSKEKFVKRRFAKKSILSKMRFLGGFSC